MKLFRRKTSSSAPEPSPSPEPRRVVVAAPAVDSEPRPRRLISSHSPASEWPTTWRSYNALYAAGQRTSCSVIRRLIMLSGFRKSSSASSSPRRCGVDVGADGDGRPSRTDTPLRDLQTAHRRRVRLSEMPAGQSAAARRGSSRQIPHLHRLDLHNGRRRASFPYVGSSELSVLAFLADRCSRRQGHVCLGAQAGQHCMLPRNCQEFNWIEGSFCPLRSLEGLQIRNKRFCRCTILRICPYLWLRPSRRLATRYELQILDFQLRFGSPN